MKLLLELFLIVLNVVYISTHSTNTLQYDEDKFNNEIFTTNIQNTRTNEDDELINSFSSAVSPVLFYLRNLDLHGTVQNLNTEASTSTENIITTDSPLYTTTESSTTNYQITSSITSTPISITSSDSTSESTPIPTTNSDSSSTIENHGSTIITVIPTTKEATSIKEDPTTDISYTSTVSPSNQPTINPTSNIDTTSSSSSTTHTNYCEGDVENVIFEPDPFSINITWDAPKSNSECDYTYEIVWEKEKNYNTSTNTSYYIKDLNACTEYKIEILTFHGISEVGSFSNNTRTTQIEPYAVTFNSPNITNNRVNITWKPDASTVKCIESYNVIIYRGNQSVFNTTTYNTEIVENNIPTCTHNIYEVIPQPNGVSNSLLVDTTTVNEAPEFTNHIIENNALIIKWNLRSPCQVDNVTVDCTSDKNNESSISNKIEGSMAYVIFSLDQLTPYTEYNCCATVNNVKGSSNPSCTGPILTPSKEPDSPTILKVEEIENGLHITWKLPKNWNGKKENINVTVENLGLSYEHLEECVSPFPTEPISEILDANMTDWSFINITASTIYNIIVKAKSDGGWSEATSQNITTRNKAPEEPSVEYQIKLSRAKEFDGTVFLKIIPPCITNGQLKGFSIEVNGSRPDFLTHEFSYNLTINTIQLFYKDNLTDLKPEYAYTVTVCALVEHFFGLPTSTEFKMPAGIPVPHTTSSNWKPPDLDDSDPTSAKVQFPRDLFNTSMGDIWYFAIIVAQDGCEEAPTADYYKFWPSVNSNCSDISEAFQATPINWQPEGRTNIISFTLGSDENKCKNATEDYCNRALNTNTNYLIKIRGFTKNAFSDTDLIEFLTGEDYVNIGLIVGLVIGILALASIVVIFLFYRNGSVNFKNWPRMKSVSEMSPAPLPVAIKKFDSHFRAMTENAGRIQSEFQLLSTITSDVTNSTTAALLPINKKKNRYVNILPYDETRVKLTSTDSTSSDYINASIIKGYSGNVEYIATQGPTDTTCLAFWEMVLEKKVKLIVMLTQFIELGKEKCYRYFPDLKEELDIYNDIKIQCMEEQLFQVYNRRILKVKKNGATKHVTHIQFNLWPDFGVPTKVYHMLDFCEIIKDIKMKSPGLIVMHCSAGVGRTGTLIALDILLQAIKDKRKVDIFGTVLNLRKQRMNMVQSERQYEFLYKCVHHIIMKKGNIGSIQDMNQISESNML